MLQVILYRLKARLDICLETKYVDDLFHIVFIHMPNK